MRENIIEYEDGVTVVIEQIDPIED